MHVRPTRLASRRAAAPLVDPALRRVDVRLPRSARLMVAGSLPCRGLPASARFAAALLATVLLATTLLTATAAAQVPVDRLAGITARSIGPAGMSGRVACVAAHPEDRNLIVAGAASGGLWVSRNAGLTFEPVFDDQPVASIGAVALHARKPYTVWVGTGEGNPRNSSSIGRGVFRSDDAGRTWRHLGLARSERIHRIVLHPDDPETAWVAALGPAWRAGGERGVFKTTDGGRSWQHVLDVDEDTGCCDLVIDPRDPDRLLAATWTYRRWPWTFRSGGPGSGVWSTRDGGRTWTRLGTEHGLPGGELGRIGLGIAPSRPDVVYALVEAEHNVLLRSDDGGHSFRTVNREPDIAPRPFYYCDIRVDPQDHKRVYNLHSLISVSDDGGRTFRTLVAFNDIHPDHHAMWIDPTDARRIVIGNDGGVGISHDRGESWRFVANLPLAQYYHVAVDDESPYHVYGGMQDNGSWRGPAAVRENGGIRNHHWEEVGFGDGFSTYPHPEDPLVGWSMSQQGYLMRWDLRTGERKSVRPAGPDGVPLRFSWNAAFAVDPHEPGTVYLGSQLVHRSRDGGDTWEILSPDLTTDREAWQRQAESGGLTPDVTGAENFTTLLAIAPSRLEEGVIWTGSDDGRVHVTRDGGETWQPVEDRIPDLPASTWVPHIAPSRHEAGVAYAVFDDHRRGDDRPYVYRAEDYGARWIGLSAPPLDGFAHVVLEDPVEPRLLWVGTELGLWVSFDRGATWAKWTHGLPTVPVRDLVVQEREHDLVIGTHGRAAYVIDDLRPLRALCAEPELLDRLLHVFAVGPAQQYRVKQTGASRFPGAGEFRGENEPYGALITVAAALPDDAKARKLAVRILDDAGDEIRSFERDATGGVQRIVWPLRRKGVHRPRPGTAEPDDEPRGPEVLPGDYTVVVRLGEEEVRQPVTVLADPRFTIPVADRVAKQQAIDDAGALVDALARAVRRIERIRADLAHLQGKLPPAADAGGSSRPDGAAPPDDDPAQAFRERAKTLTGRLADLEKRLWTRPGTKGIPSRDHVYGRASGIFGRLQSSWDAPTPAQLDELRQARDAVETLLSDLDETLSQALPDLRDLASRADLVVLPPHEPIRIRGR